MSLEKKIQEDLLRDGLAYFVGNNGKVYSMHLVRRMHTGGYDAVFANEDRLVSIPNELAYNGLRILEGLGIRTSEVPDREVYAAAVKIVNETNTPSHFVHSQEQVFELVIRVDGVVLLSESIIAQERTNRVVRPTPEGREALSYERWLEQQPVFTLTKNAFEPYVKYFAKLAEELTKPLAPGFTTGYVTTETPQALKPIREPRTPKGTQGAQGTQEATPRKKSSKGKPINPVMRQAFDRARPNARDEAKETQDADQDRQAQPTEPSV